MIRTSKSKAGPAPGGLATGDEAPEFECEALDGGRISLSAFRGKPLLLSFHPDADCPVVSLRLRQLAARHEQVAQGAHIVAVFDSGHEALGAAFARWRPPFRLVADVDGQLRRAFRVSRERPGLLRRLARACHPRAALATALGRRNAAPVSPRWAQGVPADFVIDPDGSIVLAHYGREPFDHLRLKEIERALAVPHLKVA